jgi:hypothetical protein
LASAAAIATGRKATVFNPAGLNDKTIAIAAKAYFKYIAVVAEPTEAQTVACRSDSKKNITVLATSYDLITQTQNEKLTGLVLPHTYGTIYNLKPTGTYKKLQATAANLLDYLGLRVLNVATGVDPHLMGSVFDGLGVEAPNLGP